jgi:hypothetical protein
MSGAYGPPHVTIHAEYQAGSHKAWRRADNRAMRPITVEMVCSQCDAPLRRTHPNAWRKAG